MGTNSEGLKDIYWNRFTAGNGVPEPLSNYLDVSCLLFCNEMFTLISVIDNRRNIMER